MTPRYTLTTVGDLVETGPPSEFGQRVFVRPDSALKPFSGRVLERDQITLRALDHGFFYDDDSLPVVVAPEITIGHEWRFVVVGATVVAGSDYTSLSRTAGAALSPEHPAWGYAADLASKVEPPDPVFVLDVCETDAGLRLLEFNPFGGADLYGCDRAAIVGAVHALLA
ncbi:ATP-grasp domain-containing protein [Jiangella mangrovi]|uniref:ATP-grasp domain-containing protein n=1 Tax=Jiangella mangrovi TaxID=1524084 RepID=UPI0031B5B986